MAGLGRTRPALGVAAKRAAMAGVELRAGRAACVLSRRRHAGLGGTEDIVGGLEGGSSVSFASGMAIAAIFDQLPTGSIVALPDDCYQGVVGLANAGQNRGRWTVHRLAVTDTAGWIEMCGAADLIWLESPSNPLLTLADLDVICAAPRKRGAILGVDNTFATPLIQRPLALGADVAVQSVTKFIGGHSDLLGGVVTVRDANLLAAAADPRARGCHDWHSRNISRGPRG